MRRNNAKEKNKINKNWSFEKIKIANPLGRLNKSHKESDTTEPLNWLNWLTDS